MLHHFWGRHTFIPLDAHSIPFGAPTAGTRISQSRALQRKGLRMQQRFFTHLERPQMQGVIDGQALRGCLIESDTPTMQGTKIKETPCYLFTGLWCAHRVTKHDSDLAHQLIIHQSCSTRCQELPVFGSQPKECERVVTIEAQQFCFWIMNRGMLVLWIGICYRRLLVHSARVLQKERVRSRALDATRQPAPEMLVDHSCVVAQSYNRVEPPGPESSPALELTEEDCQRLGGTALQCCFTQFSTSS